MTDTAIVVSVSNITYTTYISNTSNTFMKNIFGVYIYILNSKALKYILNSILLKDIKKIQ